MTPNEDSPDALLAAALAGDRDALGRLLEHNRERLLGRIRLVLGGDARRYAESGDFLQQLFVEILESWGRFQGDDEQMFLRWAMRIARNNIIDHVRRKRERAFESFAASVSRDDPLVPEDEATPEEAALRQEDADRVLEAIEELAPAMQRVIELKHFEGLRFEEIGRRMDRSENAAQLLHARALVRLGRALRA